MKSRFTVSAGWVLVTLVPTVMMVPSRVEAAKTTLSVLTNNVYFLPEILNWGQRTRARLIAASDYIKGFDVIVIEECFATAPCSILREGLKSQYPYQTPTLGRKKSEWDSTLGSPSSIKPENGGVVVMSKWPIKQKHQYVFGGGCGADRFASKGFIYIVLDYEGTNLHVFATHMQSDDASCSAGKAAMYRAQALVEWRKFIDSRQISSNELVIMAGDFNIDKNTDEFNTTLVEKFQAHQPDAYDGHVSTWDPIENSLAHSNSPGITHRDYIDYVFVDKQHNIGVKAVVQTVLKVHSSNYMLGWKVFNDYSDHFPVKTVIELDKPGPEEQQQQR
ncbi:sphingomyelinase C [Dissophora ornata]|nr:hypothetical protein BGZ58_005013 [Dissophora ornata]KAI8604259.1 sphingomyelinase C [Dissophora ornata]